MTGVNQRDAVVVGKSDTDITRICVVTVHEVRPIAFVSQPSHQIVRQTVQVIPELFLRQVLFRACVDTDDADVFADLLNWLGVVGTEVLIDQAPGNEIHLTKITVCAERSRQVYNVLHLTSCIRVPPELVILPPDQPMHTEHDQVFAFRFACVRHDVLFLNNPDCC